MADRELIIKACEKWLKSHDKTDCLSLAYEAVQDLVSVLKEHNAKTAGDNNLELCPFCGSEAKIVIGTEYVGDIVKETFDIVCTNPECIIFDGYGRSFYTLENAKDAWNNRI